MAVDPNKKPDGKAPNPRRRSKAEEEARAALAKYREQADQATHDLLINARPDQLIRPDLTAEILKGNVIPASVWTFGPGSQLFSVQFDERLTAIAKYLKVKLVNQQVPKLAAYFLEGTEVLVMRPAPRTDDSAFLIRRPKSGGVKVNLSDMLIAQGVAVESNYKELRRVIMVPDESPLWPALIVNYALRPDERKFVPRSKGATDEGEAEKSSRARVTTRTRDERGKYAV
jgi:hypothetical protein